MTYTVTDEIYDMTIHFLALLNCDIHEMERKHQTRNISYKCMKERLKGEINMFSFLFDVEVQEVFDLVSNRTNDIERAYIAV